jgi:hypothetical protein
VLTSRSVFGSLWQKWLKILQYNPTGQFDCFPHLITACWRQLNRSLASTHILFIPGCWQVLSPTRKEKSYGDRRFWFSYILFIIISGRILVLFIYNKTSIERNIHTIKHNKSGSRSGSGLISTPVLIWVLRNDKHMPPKWSLFIYFCELSQFLRTVFVMRVLFSSYVYLLYLCVFVVSYVYLLHRMCICCILCVFVLLCVYCCSYFRCRTAG